MIDFLSLLNYLISLIYMFFSYYSFSLKDFIHAFGFHFFKIVCYASLKEIAINSSCYKFSQIYIALTDDNILTQLNELIDSTYFEVLKCLETFPRLFIKCKKFENIWILMKMYLVKTHCSWIFWQNNLLSNKITIILLFVVSAKEAVNIKNMNLVSAQINFTAIFFCIFFFFCILLKSTKYNP